MGGEDEHDGSKSKTDTEAEPDGEEKGGFHPDIRPGPVGGAGDRDHCRRDGKDRG